MSAVLESTPLPPYTHLLVPVDYAGCAWQVVGHAARLAAAFGARVTLLYVVDPPSGVHLSDSLSSTASVGALLDAEAQDELNALTRAFPPQVPVELRVLHGAPAPHIVAEASRGAADLIVMGTHGRTGFSRLLVGSVAEQVMRGASVPVVVIRGGEGTPDRRPPAWDRAADEATG